MLDCIHCRSKCDQHAIFFLFNRSCCGRLRLPSLPLMQRLVWSDLSKVFFSPPLTIEAVFMQWLMPTDGGVGGGGVGGGCRGVLICKAPFSSWGRDGTPVELSVSLYLASLHIWRDASLQRFAGWQRVLLTCRRSSGRRAEFCIFYFSKGPNVLAETLFLVSMGSCFALPQMTQLICKINISLHV